MLNKVLHRGIFQEQQSGDSRFGFDDRKDREILAIQKAFKLSELGGVVCHPGWEEHGFVSVMAGQPEEDFEVELDEDEVPVLSSAAHTKKMLQVQVEVSSTAAKGAKEVKTYNGCMTALKST